MKQTAFSIWRVLLGCVMYAAMTFALANYFLVRPRFSQAYPLFCAFVTVLLPLLIVFWGGIFFKKLLGRIMSKRMRKMSVTMACSDNIKKTSMEVDNLVVVEGGIYTNIKKALRQWMESYASDLPDDFSFTLFTNENGIHFIQVDERLDNDLFYFLVNYLDCPKGIKHDVSVKGFTTGKKKGLLKGKKLLVYISPTDKEGDNVFVVTSDNENFKISFGGKITKIEGNAVFEPPMELKFNNPEIIKRDKQQEERKKRVQRFNAEPF